MEVVGHDINKAIWEVVDYHFVEEATDNDEIGLRGFDFNFLTNTKRG